MASAGSSLMGIGTATGTVEKLFWSFMVVIVLCPIVIILHSHAKLFLLPFFFISYWHYKSHLVYVIMWLCVHVFFVPSLFSISNSVQSNFSFFTKRL